MDEIAALPTQAAALMVEGLADKIPQGAQGHEIFMRAADKLEALAADIRRCADADMGIAAPQPGEQA